MAMFCFLLQTAKNRPVKNVIYILDTFRNSCEKNKKNNKKKQIVKSI